MSPDDPPVRAGGRHRSALTVRLILLLCLFASAAPAGAQTLSLSGGAITLRIDSAVPGSELTEETDESTLLQWEGGGGLTTKVTVETDCPGQSFSLYVAPTGHSGSGTSQGEVALTHLTPRDLIRGIPHNGGNRKGRANLRYRAVSTTAQGTSATEGDDVHLITYTILAQ